MEEENTRSSAGPAYKDLNLKVTSREKRILRQLAAKVLELSGRSIEKEKKKLWTRHNDLKTTRPLIFIDPENGWNEIITENEIKCENALLKSWEMRLRKEIFWGEKLKDDKVIEPYFDINYIFEESHYGLRERKIRVSEKGSFKYDPPVKDYEKDFEKLQYPELNIYEKKTKYVYELAEDIFGDILNVRIKGNWWWSLGMTWDYISLRGLDQLMMDFYDNPEWVHRMMNFLKDCIIKKIDFLEKNNYLAINTGGTYVGSGGFGWTDDLPGEDFNPEKVRTRDMWGFAESQETSSVSPEMFEEFIFPYQKEILKRFGLNCYGCCEPLDNRWHIIKNIPRLRRVSVSPWADEKVMSDKLKQDYIYSLKPNPAPLAKPELNEKNIRKDIREKIKITEDNIVEIIMKDNHTIGGNPNNPIRWVEIVKEEIEKCEN
ncbi:MAG: hypothetical protein ACOCRX_10545 [Candidatus Woesearchaeota archaeon]